MELDDDDRELLGGPAHWDTSGFKADGRFGYRGGKRRAVAPRIRVRNLDVLRAVVVAHQDAKAAARREKKRVYLISYNRRRKPTHAQRHSANR